MDELGENHDDQIIGAELALRNAQRLLASQTNDQNGKPIALHATSGGMVPIEDTVEIIERLDQLPLSAAAIGDVVWWLTQTGTRGYFVIEDPYEDPGKGLNEMKAGRGELLISRKEGQHLRDQRGKGFVRGSAMGSMLKVGTLVKGMSVEYGLSSGERTKTYTSTPVVEMGLIRTGTLSQPA